MEEHYAALERELPAAGLLGYLNFSEGKPDPRWQRQLNDAFRFLAEHGASEPWQALHAWLADRLKALHAGGNSAFRDATQVQAVLPLAFTKVLPAYRAHHADLLFHQSDPDLFQPFFLVRVCEAVLTQGPPWQEEERIVAGALARLNDFVGHRPIAILETRPKGEPYDHERVRPIPLYLREAGVAWGRYGPLLAKALEILAATDPAILHEACFDLKLLDELAVDPRAYDHGHPVNRRPNYVFGEWDPHHLDNQGRFRRYVIRQVTLDALLSRITASSDQSAMLLEAAAVLAGTLLMASGISGSGPTTHDSTTTLATLMPRIARYRDAFYIQLLEKLTGPHAQRLRQEMATTRQSFGGARQHLNQYLARHRALQLQQRHLTLLFAEMGYPQASRKEAAHIPAASLRLQGEVLGRLATGALLAEQRDYAAAAALMPELEDLVKRGVACGAFADPWNILGFQGLFPLFQAREDSVRDPRIDDMVDMVERILDLYTWLMGEAAAAGDQELRAILSDGMAGFALWWDQFASFAVSDVRLVLANKHVNAAEAVAAALVQWRQRGEATGDLAFWKKHLRHFDSPQAFALIVDALLNKEDYGAGMALLMTWLSQAESVGLEEGDYSFHALALRWVLAVLTGDGNQGSGVRGQGSGGSTSERWTLVKRFFDYLEANAESYWHVPSLEDDGGAAEADGEHEEDVYGAAYEDVTYRDSTDDGFEGEVEEIGPPREVFELEEDAERIGQRLRFLSTVARLWLLAAQQGTAREEHAEALRGWLAAAQTNHRKLLNLLDVLHACPVPEPLGSHDSLVEYDQRRVLKEQLLYAVIGTCLDTALAIGALQGSLGTMTASETEAPAWQPLVLRLEQALLRGGATEARRTLPRFLELFQKEPLLFTALADGGEPGQILRVRLAQSILRALVGNLPRLGLLRETYLLLQTAREMERRSSPGPLPSGNKVRGVSEFNQLFQAGYQAAVECVVESASTWDPAQTSNAELVTLLEALTRPFLTLWIEFSRTLHLSSLENVRGDDDWNALRDFVKRYGGGLFHAKFMTLANLRGVLHRGLGPYLDYLRDNDDPLHPLRLLEDLDAGTVRREDAERHLHFVLQAVVENYEEYKDYNTTTTHSDYGENLHVLLDFLRLKASYERHAWQFQPLALVHEVLARYDGTGAAALWQQGFTQITHDLAVRHLEELARLEQTHGLRLGTVRDRLQEQFVKVLALDGLCALIEPAMVEAEEGERSPAFARLEQQLRPHAANPAGVGLDVPHWLRRLEQEVQRVRAANTTIAVLAENLSQVPRRALSFDELRRQLQDWQK